MKAMKTLKKYEKLWKEIRDLITSITINSWL